MRPLLLSLALLLACTHAAPRTSPVDVQRPQPVPTIVVDLPVDPHWRLESLQPVYDAVVAWWTLACVLGDREACNRASHALVILGSPPVLWDLVWSLRSQYCRVDDQRTCMPAWTRCRSSEPPAFCNDPQARATELKRAYAGCNHDNPEDCVLLIAPSHLAPPPSMRLVAHRRLCVMGIGCGLAASGLYKAGRRSEARDYFELACKLESDCGPLAYGYSRGLLDEVYPGRYEELDPYLRSRAHMFHDAFPTTSLGAVEDLVHGQP